MARTKTQPRKLGMEQEPLGDNYNYQQLLERGAGHWSLILQLMYPRLALPILAWMELTECIWWLELIEPALTPGYLRAYCCQLFGLQWRVGNLSQFALRAKFPTRRRMRFPHMSYGMLGDPR